MGPGRFMVIKKKKEGMGDNQGIFEKWRKQSTIFAVFKYMDSVVLAPKFWQFEIQNLPKFVKMLNF